MTLVTAVLANIVKIAKIVFKEIVDYFRLNNPKNNDDYSGLTICLLLMLIVWISFFSHPILFVGFIVYALMGLGYLIVTEAANIDELRKKGWSICTIFFVVTVMCISHMSNRPDLNSNSTPKAETVVEVPAPVETVKADK